MTERDQFSLRTLLGVVGATALVLGACVTFGTQVLILVLFILITSVAAIASDPPPGDRLSFPFRLLMVATLSPTIGAGFPLLNFTGRTPVVEEVNDWIQIGLHLAPTGVIAGVIVGSLLFWVAKCGQRLSLLVAEGVSFAAGFCAMMHLIRWSASV